MPQDLFGSPPNSLGRLVEALRAVHKSLIDSTRRDYEKRHGRIENPYALWRLVAQDPAFAWLRPMTQLIVELEESSDLDPARGKVRELLSDGEFAAAYQARVQSDPEVAVEHGRLQSALPPMSGS